MKRYILAACKRLKNYDWYAHGANTWIIEYSKLIGSN